MGGPGSGRWSEPDPADAGAVELPELGETEDEINAAVDAALRSYARRVLSKTDIQVVEKMARLKLAAIRQRNSHGEIDSLRKRCDALLAELAKARAQIAADRQKAKR